MTVNIELHGHGMGEDRGRATTGRERRIRIRCVCQSVQNSSTLYEGSSGHADGQRFVVVADSTREDDYPSGKISAIPDPDSYARAC